MTATTLDRFVEAQQGTIGRALAELAAGRKQGHWMWFVFPQLRGLGRSATAEFYGLAGLDETRRYLSHPLLGSRYEEGCLALLAWAGQRSAGAILGEIDALKLRSSLTLFEAAAKGTPQAALPARLLDEFFAGERDRLTLDLLVERP